MKKSDIYSEIIQCIRENGTSSVSIETDVLKDLYSPLNGRKTAKPMQTSGFPSEKQNAEKASAAARPLPGTNTLSAVNEASWEELEELVRNCKNCPLHASGRIQTVFGAGNRSAELMFVGEGPGGDEDKQGLPFVGRAGELLTRMINAMQFSRNDVYIANIVKCRPPLNRAPEEMEGNTCLPFVCRQIELVQPKVIVLLGATPLKYLLRLSGITKLRGHWLEYKGIKVMPTFHPAYLLRNESMKAPVWKDLQAVMQVFGKKPPAGRKT